MTQDSPRLFKGPENTWRPRPLCWELPLISQSDDNILMTSSLIHHLSEQNRAAVIIRPLTVIVVAGCWLWLVLGLIAYVCVYTFVLLCQGDTSMQKPDYGLASWPRLWTLTVADSFLPFSPFLFLVISRKWSLSVFLPTKISIAAMVTMVQEQVKTSLNIVVKPNNI